MAQEISPDKQCVMSCLSKKSYFVDFYQREYVWSKTTVDILLRDIFYAFDITLRMRNSNAETEEDYILSPVAIDGKQFCTAEGLRSARPEPLPGPLVREHILNLHAPKLGHKTEKQRHPLKESVVSREYFYVFIE